ncbi:MULTISPECIES: CoxG family protein [Rhodoplanes]|nr:carbon monoxide dehydrogenase subunit G [Rhodoplanes serenus]
MAMTMTGQVVLPTDRATVWAAINDPDILRQSIPGCQDFAKVSDTEFTATVKVAVGPVKATFKGRVQLTDIEAPTGCRIVGEGQGGVAGFAKGGARVRLDDAPDGGTRLDYDVEAQIGGKLAQLGGRLVNGVAKKYADEFFGNLSRALAPATPDAPAGDTTASDPAPRTAPVGSSS